MSRVEIIVDGRTVSAEADALLIEVLLKNGIEIPYFCYHEALGPDGNCRMCMVEIEGQKRPQIACDTLVRAGMSVRTKGENIDAVRRNILELELLNHPVDCPICDQAGECKLQDFYMDYGLHDAKIEKREKVTHRKHVDLGANVMLDQERCVLCARCTRFTSEITKTHELGIIGRGDHARVSTMPGRSLENPYAMNVIDLCPVGALTSKDFRFHQRVWFLTSTPSVCHGCAAGCNIWVDHNREKYKDDRIYRFRPRVNREVNGWFICDAGRLSYEALQENRRLDMLLNKEACDEVRALEYFRDALKRHKGAVTILVDADRYSEEMEAVKVFAERHGAALYCPAASYDDPAFGDDWLRSSCRAANLGGAEKLGIERTLPDALETGLLINVNHPDGAKFKAEMRIELQTHVGRDADLILPLAVFTECAGTLVNEQGVAQFCPQAVHRNRPIPSAVEWVERLEEAPL
ncbi:2Fe-2S iron-sulfur cluster-binding protein [Sulfurimonas sp. HSL1-2]|uniref:2Fe-2S iron-sulfur cluster-binding protein n=1 Tax=Thiomicrolovo zhangzhouensis TaxID=3131933 RepID=UPI0031F8C27C